MGCFHECLCKYVPHLKFSRTLGEFREWLNSENTACNIDAGDIVGDGSLFRDDCNVIISEYTSNLVLKGDCGAGNKLINTLSVRIPNNLGGQQIVELNKCFIRVIDISGSPYVRLTLKNCFVDRIRFDRCVFLDLEIIGGCLFGIEGESQASEKHRPFLGRVTIKNLHLPRNIEEAKPGGGDDDRAKLVYEFRNMRMYLSKKGDVLPAGIFHAAELALERVDENAVSKTFSWLYEKLSDYGNSVSKPLWWLFASWLVLFVSCVVPDMIGYASSVVVDGCYHASDPSLALIGWREDLCRSFVWRSLAYPFYATLNPMNILVIHPLMTSASMLWAIFHLFISLFGTVNLALLVLALRRRFKLEKVD